MIGHQGSARLVAPLPVLGLLALLPLPDDLQCVGRLLGGVERPQQLLGLALPPAFNLTGLDVVVEALALTGLVAHGQQPATPAVPLPAAGGRQAGSTTNRCVAGSADINRTVSTDPSTRPSDGQCARTGGSFRSTIARPFCGSSCSTVARNASPSRPCSTNADTAPAHAFANSDAFRSAAVIVAGSPGSAERAQSGTGRPACNARHTSVANRSANLRSGAVTCAYGPPTPPCWRCSGSAPSNAVYPAPRSSRTASSRNAASRGRSASRPAITSDTGIDAGQEMPSTAVTRRSTCT